MILFFRAPNNKKNEQYFLFLKIKVIKIKLFSLQEKRDYSLSQKKYQTSY